MNGPLWISEQEVASVMSMTSAIAALEKGLEIEASGKARNMVKTHVNFLSHGNLHAIGAAFETPFAEGIPGVIGTKTWAHTDGGAMPLLVLFNAGNGQLLAVIEAFALGQLRTGGISGVATRWLARTDADELAVVGAGKQALAQVGAVNCVRPLKRVRVFSRSEEKRHEFTEKLKKKFPAIAVEAFPSVNETVQGAPIVTIVTRATEPFLGAPMLAPGAHINAVGAITPERAEFHQDLFPRAHRLAADSIEQVKKLSREFRDQFGDDPNCWTHVESIATVVSRKRLRTETDDLSIFKAMGVGISDLSVGIEVLRQARQKKLGREIPMPVRAEISFT